ncbi:trypsin-like serine peptidase [Pendulispora albinea]|uniref:Trypsin-like serine protease n=1 Tax=Pendulispora albinea TaxID=2741071 RepID=A0ABZ2M9X0_9BACT
MIWNNGIAWILAVGAAAGAVGCSSDAGQDEEKDQQTSPLYQAPIDQHHPFAVGICTGTLNTDPALGEVGACVANGNNTRCTGSLIAPNLVLTARHCVHDITPPPVEDDFQCTDAHVFTENPLFPGGIRVTTSHSALFDHPVWIDVKRVVISPFGSHMCKDDVALLILQRNVTDAAPAWVDLDRDLKTSPPSDGKVAVVGRGRVTPTDRGKGERRFLRDVPFTCVGPCDLPWGDNGFVFHAVDGQFAIGRSGLPGDSGSGILLNETFDTNPTIIGLDSLGFEDAAGLPLHSVAVAIRPHAAWISTGAYQAAKYGRYPVPGWAKIPEPGTPPPVD